MSRWVRAESAPEEDIRLSYIVRRRRQPEVYELVSRVNVRGGLAAVVRTLLDEAARSGRLKALVDKLAAGDRVATDAGPPHLVASETALSPQDIERMRSLNRF